jgi:hypothetical protein
MSDTKVLSVHKLRFMARLRERRIQGILNATGYDRDWDRRKLEVPGWARGVRVEKAGRFQWAVVATTRKGH